MKLVGQSTGGGYGVDFAGGKHLEDGEGCVSRGEGEGEAR